MRHFFEPFYQIFLVSRRLNFIVARPFARTLKTEKRDFFIYIGKQVSFEFLLFHSLLKKKNTTTSDSPFVTCRSLCDMGSDESLSFLPFFLFFSIQDRTIYLRKKIIPPITPVLPYCTSNVPSHACIVQFSFVYAHKYSLSLFFAFD